MRDTFYRPADSAALSHRADRTNSAARLSAARRSARRERVRARRHRRTRGTVQHRGRPFDLRADDAERRHVRRRADHLRLDGRAVHAPHRGTSRTWLGYRRRRLRLGTVSHRARVRPHRIHRARRSGSIPTARCSSSCSRIAFTPRKPGVRRRSSPTFAPIFPTPRCSR